MVGDGIFCLVFFLPFLPLPRFPVSGIHFLVPVPTSLARWLTLGLLWADSPRYPIGAAIYFMPGNVT